MKTTIILLILAFGMLPMQSEAKVPYNSDFCDKIFAATFFGEVDGEFKECKSRFQWNVNRIKTSFNQK